MRRAWSVMSLLVCVTGCLILPIPTPEHGSVSRRPVREEELPRELRPGETTMADVLLLLGEPDFSLRNDGVLAYAWDRVAAYVVFAVPGGGTVTPLACEHLLLLEFDAAGVLRRSAVQQAVGLDPFEGAREWARQSPGRE